jgi:hypothetical protein
VTRVDRRAFTSQMALSFSGVPALLTPDGPTVNVTVPSCRTRMNRVRHCGTTTAGRGRGRGRVPDATRSRER